MRHRPARPSLSTDQNILDVCDIVKVLGVIIQGNLRWDSQEDHMLTSANRKLEEEEQQEDVQKRACKIILGQRFLFSLLLPHFGGVHTT